MRITSGVKFCTHDGGIWTLRKKGLLQDADGKVKTIIVKDFSRFARDYIEAGDYMERIFPLLGVRFISVNDGYDSGMQAGNDVRGLEVAIKNIINASYSRDLSAKIAAADHVMQKKGMYLGGSAEGKGLLWLLPEINEISCSQETWPLV